eukprot:SAG31_NODE_3860_length_3814_cov_2.455720_6_plen_98_part_00
MVASLAGSVEGDAGLLARTTGGDNGGEELLTNRIDGAGFALFDPRVFGMVGGLVGSSFTSSIFASWVTNWPVILIQTDNVRVLCWLKVVGSFLLLKY